MSSEHSRFNVYRAVTEQIMKAIAAGTGGAAMPWHSGSSTLVPVNAFTGNRYRGVNVVALWAASVSNAFTSHNWATYRQWGSLGAQVRAKERSSFVVFFKRVEADTKSDDTEDGHRRVKLVARASRVFNADQVDGFERPATLPTQPAAVIAEAERFVARTGATVRHGGSAAFYSPTEDYIQLPERAAFIGTKTSSPTESYYAVLLHELVHWSGAPHRLARDLGTRFGSRSYAMEELVAELGAAFLCCDLGITPTPRQDHANYIAGWLEALSADSKAIFAAASKAKLASEYLQGLRIGANADRREAEKSASIRP